MLVPMLGSGAAIIFALALLFAGISSSVTAGMAGGSIYAGIFSEPYDIKDNHTKTGVLITLVTAAILILFISDPFKGLVLFTDAFKHSITYHCLHADLSDFIEKGHGRVRKQHKR